MNPQASPAATRTPLLRDLGPTQGSVETTRRCSVASPSPAAGHALLVSDAGRHASSTVLRAGLWTAGRSTRCELRIQDPTVSRRHCQLQVGPDAVWLVDLDSSNGTRVNGVWVQSRPLAHGDVVEIGASSLTLVPTDSPQWRALDRLTEQACCDDLTGLLNRRGFRQRIDAAFALARAGARVGLLVIDADRFKLINDRHGHAVGDRVLRHIAEAIRALQPDTGFAARVGGEEFAMVLPQSTPAQARTLAHTLCRRVAAHPLVWNDAIVSATISIGLASAAVDDGAAAGFARADAALYRAKQTGRNRVCE